MIKITNIRPTRPKGMREFCIPIKMPEPLIYYEDGSCPQIEEILKDYPENAILYTYIWPEPKVRKLDDVNYDFRIPQHKFVVIYYEPILQL